MTSDNKFCLTSENNHLIVEKLSDNSLKLTQRDRLEALLLKNNGLTNKEIAEKLNVNEHSVSTWLKNYKEQGLMGVLRTSGRYPTNNSIDVNDTIDKNNQNFNYVPPIFVSHSTILPAKNDSESGEISAKLVLENVNLTDFSGNEISLCLAALVKTKDGAYHILNLKDITPNIDIIDYSSVDAFQDSVSEINKLYQDAARDISNNLTEETVKQKSLVAVNDKNLLRSVQFDDLSGRLNIEVPSEFKSMNGNSRIYINQEMCSFYKSAVGISTYRKGTDLVNKIFGRNDENCIHFITVHSFVCQDGKNLESYMEKFKQENLEQYGFNPITGSLENPDKLPDGVMNPYVPYNEELQDYALEAIQDYNDEKTEKDEFISFDVLEKEIINHPDDTVAIGVDEILVHSQEKDGKQVDNKANELSEHNNITNEENNDKKRQVVKIEYNRNKPSTKYKYKNNRKVKVKRKKSKKNRRYLKRAVVHILTKEGSYMLIAKTLEEVLLLTLSLLLKKGYLVNRELIFFTDGATAIMLLIKKIFFFRPFSIKLDWFHLKHKTYGFFTMALHGGPENYERNNAIRQKFYSLIFAGNIDEAKAYLDSIDKKIIKSQKCLDAIKEYLDRKREFIYCYALRKEMHLQNSSSLVEKANDILVANRCKRKAMSWVERGISGMTAILFISANHEDEWNTSKQIKFNFNSESKKIHKRISLLNKQLAA